MFCNIFSKSFAKYATPFQTYFLGTLHCTYAINADNFSLVKDIMTQMSNFLENVRLDISKNFIFLTTIFIYTLIRMQGRSKVKIEILTDSKHLDFCLVETFSQNTLITFRNYYKQSLGW